MSPPASLPFKKNAQLCADLDSYSSTDNSTGFPTMPLPGHPHLGLDDTEGLRKLLLRELWADDLERLARHLWVMSTQSSANVKPLHYQRVNGRQILVTEDPRLHLVWIHDRIFIKPLPTYLLSRAFWDLFLLGEPSKLGESQKIMRKAAMGYLRTYCYLIQYESDFRIAKHEDLRLVPESIDWMDFSRFLADLKQINDADVSERYHYGELRLSRLNFYAPLFLRKFYYEQVYGEYSDYFSRLYGPILFAFTLVMTILNSMQVGMAVDQVSAAQWTALWPFCRWFSTISLALAALISLFIMLLWGWLLADEWIYAIECRLRKRRGMLYQQSSSC